MDDSILGWTSQATRPVTRKRTSAEQRVRAFQFCNHLKAEGYSRSETVKLVIDAFGISHAPVYAWYDGSSTPFVNARLQLEPEFFYILGAFIGDGCVYSWKPGHHQIIIVGEKEFAEKCALKFLPVIGKRIKAYPNRRQHVWFVSIRNLELFILLKDIRYDVDAMLGLMRQGNFKRNALEFIQGFFDAEGCVKVIKEPCRKTPKICLDFCNTNFEYLELTRVLLEEHAGIVARFSTQNYSTKYGGRARKTAYHLRIYKKESVHRFFEIFHAIKLKKEKIEYVRNWFARDHLDLTCLNKSAT